MTMLNLTVVFLGYLTALVLYFINFERQNESFYSLAQKVTALTLCVHFIFIMLAISQPFSVYVTYFSQSINIVSFLMLLSSFLIESQYKARFLMLFSLPIILLFCLLSMLLAHQQQAVQWVEGSTWLWVHINLILSGFTGLVIAASTALMYLLQSAQLKSKHPGRIFLKLPSLNTLDRIHFVSLFWGVILFSLGILSGFFWARETRELPEVLKDPKVNLSFLTCFLYWIILSFRLSTLRRGQKIAAGTVFIFILLFVTVMSSFYSPSGFHKGF